MRTPAISNKAVIRLFHTAACLDLRKLAALLGVAVTDLALCQAIADLIRRGRIRQIGGYGKHASFVLASFES